MKLNLGAGNSRMPGWIAVDLFAPDADLRADLFQFPWPWSDESVDAVAMFHFLEHVVELERTVLEVHRILKTGGTFWVVVPHARNPAAYDIGHKHRFTCTTFHSIGGKCDYMWGGRRLFTTQLFKMPVVRWRWIRWTPMDWFSQRWPAAFEKFVPIAPAWIEWIGVKVQEERH